MFAFHLRRNLRIARNLKNPASFEVSFTRGTVVRPIALGINRFVQALASLFNRRTQACSGGTGPLYSLRVTSNRNGTILVACVDFFFCGADNCGKRNTKTGRGEQQSPNGRSTARIQLGRRTFKISAGGDYCFNLCKL